MMQTTKVFKNGNSQAVRIPSNLAYDRMDLEVEIEKNWSGNSYQAFMPFPFWSLATVLKIFQRFHGKWTRLPGTGRTIKDLMLRYMLDTNICIELMKNQPPQVVNKFEACFVGEVVMSAITFAELQYGVQIS